MPASSRALQHRPTVDPHALPSQCPYCDQPIPVEHAEEIRHRINARERDQAEKLSVEIRQELAREALVQMLRRHIVQIHTLRLSNVERDSKTDALYEFIRSERCLQLFARIDGHAESLLKLQA
jgi:hypothetical protein